MSGENSSFQNYNGSFQNRRPGKRSKDCGVLMDVTNSRKRACKVKAAEAITVQSHSTYLPWGDAAKGGCTSVKQRSSVASSPVTEFVDQGTVELLQSYIKENASFEVQKAFAVLAMSCAMTKWDKSVREAAQLAADITGYSERSVRKWAGVAVNDTPEDCEDLTSVLCSNRGCSSTYSLVQDEEFQMEARSFVRSNACVKGMPNMTIATFVQWIEDNYSLKVSLATGQRWLNKLGFSRTHHQKGVYFDGHDREDVVQERNVFLQDMLKYDKLSITSDNPDPQVSDGQKQIIRVVRDESTYYANCDQSFFWGDEHTNVLKQKSLGASTMVSDFVDEVSGYLEYEDETARFSMEIRNDGYFNNELFMKQVEKAISVFEAKYPYAQGLFIFDNAPLHKKISDDSLNVDKMNVNPGGKQPVMRNTTWNGEIQTMVRQRD